MTPSNHTLLKSIAGPGMLAICAVLLAATPSLVNPQAPAQPSPQAEASKNLGLSQHNFFYAGESKQERMFIIRDGRVAWSCIYPGKGEISDAFLLPNGHVLFAHQFAITEVDTDKKLVWNYDASAGTEIHTLQPYGADSILFVENGNPAKVVVINKATRTIERQFTLPVAHPDSIHGQFRRARLTPAGTLLVAHMDMGRAVEYDMTGKELWSVNAPGLWDATPIGNGNVLISGNTGKYVREVNRKGEIVWELTSADVPDYSLSNMQTATRLPSGNTLINQWFNEWSGPVDLTNPPVQAIEVTPAKKVVWVLRSWNPPADLGPSTTIQILDK